MAISYFDVWKKKMENNGGNVTQSKINTSKDLFNRNFKDDPSYKLATLRKKDIGIIDSDLDTRIVNVDTNTLKKKIYLRPDTNLDVGDYIIYPNKTYLILQIEDNLISPYSECQECNHLLQWMIDGQLYSTESYVTNKTKYTLGISSEVAGITEEDSRLSIDIPYNKITKTILSGQRFLINNKAWKTTQTDFTSVTGLLTVLLGQTDINYEIDDLELGIADYYKHKYTISLNSNSEAIVETSTYQIVTNITDNNVSISSTSIAYTSSDETIATVDLNGLVTAISVGNAIITASIGNVSTELSLTITAKTSTPVISYGHNFSQSTTIKQYVTSILTCTKTVDSVSTPLNISCTWDSIGQSLISSGKVIITTKSSSSIGIKNALITTSTMAHLTVIDIDTGTKILDNVAITFTNGL
jgi:hypothetical protein